MTEREMLPPAEWTAAGPGYSKVDAHEVFSAWVARDPSAPAAPCQDEPMTYSEVDARAARLAGSLASRGVGSGTSSPVCMYRSEDMVLASHAILRAGAAHMPIYTEYADQRIEGMRAHVTRANLRSDGSPASHTARTIDP